VLAGGDVPQMNEQGSSTSQESNYWQDVCSTRDFCPIGHPSRQFSVVVKEFK
jgi:hypothetical protein